MSATRPDALAEAVSFASNTEQTRRPSRQSSTHKYPPTDVFEVDGAEDEDAAVSTSARRLWITERGSSFLKRHPRLRRIVDYARGPQPPIALPDPVPMLDRDIHIKNVRISLRIESRLIRYTRPLTRPWLFVLLAAAYIIGLSFFVRQQWFLTPAADFTVCDAAFWGRNSQCGLDGELCAPFDNTTYEARCPAQCSSVKLLNPRIIGNEDVDFQPLVVGGGDANGTYRGDSFICAAAIHSGIISNTKGGCFNIQMIGNYTNFIGSTKNGLTSVGFPSIFPMAFQMEPNHDIASCSDLRTPALAFNVIVTALLAIVLRPKPVILFWSLFSIGFWHISLFSDPRNLPPPIDAAFGAFLPALFVGYAFWRLALRFTLPPLLARAPLETAVLFLGPWWVGVLSNMTFDNIPIERLLPQDIRKQPGGVVALVIICIVLLAVVVNQVRVMRKTGWLPRYAGWYACGGLVALVLALLPGLQFRLHHYVLAMALMPGTAWPTRLSVVYQGVLLGLFLNGIAAYGFDPILQTEAELVGDAAQGTLLPTFLTNATTYHAGNQTLAWAPLTPGWDGFSLLVDDVERYAGAALNFSLAGLQAGIPHFFRLAYTNEGTDGDYTMAATLWPNGTWADPPEGAS